MRTRADIMKSLQELILKAERLRGDMLEAGAFEKLDALRSVIFDLDALLHGMYDEENDAFGMERKSFEQDQGADSVGCENAAGN